MEFMIKS